MQTKEHLLNSHIDGHINNPINSSGVEDEWISSSFDVDRLISIRQSSPSQATTQRVDQRIIEIHAYYTSQRRKITALFTRGGF